MLSCIETSKSLSNLFLDMDALQFGTILGVDLEDTSIDMSSLSGPRAAFARLARDEDNHIFREIKVHQGQPAYAVEELVTEHGGWKAIRTHKFE